MADFSRKNSLPPAPNMPTYPGLLDSLTFYNTDTVDVLDAATQFIEAFDTGEIPDNDTTRRLVLWLDMKLGKFRGLVLASGLSAAIQVKNELSLHDSQLSRLLYDQQKSRMAELLGKFNEKPCISSTGSPNHRESRSDSQGGVPKSVVRNLPKQASLQLCMKHLSNDGCSGNGTPGKCFAKQRGHFRPKKLPANVKAYIDKSFGGLAPEFADL
ncbi:hypothetical protein PHMEG_00028308 [Phytophthora megakarya]|uniref:Uncharacterized protein n=1 Tax=Phytophthora megakarya TaxID=4795 RepID=A0A225V5U9_9STRA|nr:hypothetical protein PHMEG_00028308 [Phytophthora megakarya]